MNSEICENRYKNIFFLIVNYSKALYSVVVSFAAVRLADMGSCPENLKFFKLNTLKITC